MQISERLVAGLDQDLKGQVTARLAQLEEEVAESPPLKRLKTTLLNTQEALMDKGTLAA